MEILADDLIFDDVADLAQDARAGASRLLFVMALGKMKNPRAVGILTSLLDDPDVCAAAITSLGGVHALEARERIAALVAASTPEVRAAAKKARAKIDKSRRRRP